MKALSFIRNTFFLSILVAGLAHANEQKFAYAHLERAINEVDEGVKAKADLQKEMDSKKVMLEKKQKELMDLDESLKKQAAVMKPEAKAAKVAELQKKAAEFQQLYATTEQEFMKRKNDVMAPIVQKMQTLVEAMRVEGGYTYVLDKSVVIAAKSDLDLTSELVRRYNQTYTKGGKSGSAKK